MTVREMLVKALRDRGLDGLCNSELECGCLIGDLAPCGNIQMDCHGGRRKDGCDCGEGCDFHVVAED